jgi:hypothetical protein
MLTTEAVILRAEAWVTRAPGPASFKEVGQRRALERSVHF